MLSNLRAIRVYLEISADQNFSDYTGRLAKAIIYNMSRHLELFRGVKGVFSPIHISCLFKPKNGYMLGDPIYPTARKKNGENTIEVRSVPLNGEYVIHVGGYREFIDSIEKSVREYMNKEVVMKFSDTLVSFKIIAVADPTPAILSKRLENDCFTLYLKAPAYLFNPITPTKIKRYNVSAIETLAVPYHIALGQPTISDTSILSMFRLLGKIVEKWYSIATVKVAHIVFKNRIEPVLTGKISYIIDTATRTEHKTIEAILKTAEITGIGASRTNGFGTTTWKQK